MVARLIQGMEEQKEVFLGHDTGHQFASYPGGHLSTDDDGMAANITLGQDASTQISHRLEVV